MENLRNKLIAGRNENTDGYQKFASAQFYGKFPNLPSNFLQRTWPRNSTLGLFQPELTPWVQAETPSTRSLMPNSWSSVWQPSSTTRCNTASSTLDGPTSSCQGSELTCTNTSSTTHSRGSGRTCSTERYRTWGTGTRLQFYPMPNSLRWARM